MDISKRDRDVLRKLAEEFAEIGSDPVNDRRIQMWKDLNDLKRTKPMVWINEIPWHEMDVDGELAVVCESEPYRDQEIYLRRRLYQWRHMPFDMVAEPVVYSPLVVYDSGFGLSEVTEKAVTDESNAIVCRHYNQIIKDEDDVEKIQMPTIIHDEEKSEENYQRLREVFDGILEVQKIGKRGPWDHVGGSSYIDSLDAAAPFWFAPWDILVTWYGVAEALTDLILRPGLIHMIMSRLVDAYNHRLDRYEELNLLSLNNCNVRVGSGGLGYTDSLPRKDSDPDTVRARDTWGMAAAQIFSEVSPRMHEEFGLQYEMKWLDRFGLTYYGCCEPLHRKVEILEKIKNLRKISMSPWIELREAADNIGARYVFSFKPSPAPFADGDWNLEKTRMELIDALKGTKNCIVEVIMKDISTVRYEPQRLWEWARMASEMTEKFS
jgi:hypothetical protein